MSLSFSQDFLEPELVGWSSQEVALSAHLPSVSRPFPHQPLSHQPLSCSVSAEAKVTQGQDNRSVPTSLNAARLPENPADHQHPSHPEPPRTPTQPCQCTHLDESAEGGIAGVVCDEETHVSVAHLHRCWPVHAGHASSGDPEGTSQQGLHRGSPSPPHQVQ